MSMSTAINSVQTAIVTVLRADATLRGLLPGASSPRWNVFDDVPDSQAYPYVEIGDVLQAPDDYFANQGRAVMVTLHVWSQYQGKKQCADVLSRIAVLLDRANLSVSGAVLTRCVVESENILRDPDGRTRHGVATYRVEVSEA